MEILLLYFRGKILAAVLPLALISTAAMRADQSDKLTSMAKELADLKAKAKNNDERLKDLEFHKPWDNSKRNWSRTVPKLPPHYIPIPDTKSAIQPIINPNLAMSYDFGSFAGDFLSPTTLPLRTVNPDAAKSGRFNTHARASQLGFRTLSNTDLGEIKTEISIDFYGVGNPAETGIPLHHPRLRFGFVEVLGFTIGQSTSNFLDVDAIGETVDYGTILEGSFRHGLIKYTHAMTKHLSFAVAVEQPVTDYMTNTGLMTRENNASCVPDLTGYLKYEGSFGYLSLRGVARELRLKNTAIPVPQTFRKSAWGLGISTKLYVHNKSNLFAQTSFGQGIGRFIVLCNGQSAFYDQTLGIFDVQKAANGIIGFEHFWSEAFRTNIIYARTVISVSKRVPILTGPIRATKAINQFILNLIYFPIPSLDFGIEYGFAERKTIDLKRGKANRITFGVLYRF